jgi:hypothetical protein
MFLFLPRAMRCYVSGDACDVVCTGAIRMRCGMHTARGVTGISTFMLFSSTSIMPFVMRVSIDRLMVARIVSTKLVSIRFSTDEVDGQRYTDMNEMMGMLSL